MNVTQLNRLPPPPFLVTVTHDDMWVAQCDELGLVTEATSYDELTKRVWEIVPELYEANGFKVTPEDIRLSFVHNQRLASRIAL